MTKDKALSSAPAALRLGAVRLPVVLATAFAIALVPSVGLSQATTGVPTITNHATAKATTSAAALAPSSSQVAFPVAASNTSSKKVFAHYFPPYPVSLDNKPAAQDYYTRNYLSPTGERGKHAKVGGLLRDRPRPRAPLTGDWLIADLTAEIRQASDAGIDGFTVNIMSLSGRNWDITVGLMKAAKLSGRNFKIIPNLDANSGAARASTATIAKKLAELYRYPAAYKVNASQYMLSSFKAEGKSVAWWKELNRVLASQYGVKVALNAILLNSSDANLRRFAPISYSLGDWGTRNPVGVYARSNRAAKAHSLGKKWMAGVGVQDVRPNQRKYAEARNMETLRATWNKAIAEKSDFVQLVTWNDYSEGTSFAPSVAHGETFLDVSSYYATRFKRNATPSITRDLIYVTHRRQSYKAAPLVKHQLMSPNLGGSRTAPRDTVEVTTFLKAPAKVTLKVGSSSRTFSAPKGIWTATVPLKTGWVSASAVRTGKTVASVKSPHLVMSRLKVQDLQYYSASSRGR
ncbi:MAG: hypothetical protein JWN06_3027 [Propionibacteriaceae bacterium]|jgi:hypothetical protein|nr:hypothetical protein [Propionibacteriaceae bacterium]